jgi:hypothetical protein
VSVRFGPLSPETSRKTITAAPATSASSAKSLTLGKRLRCDVDDIWAFPATAPRAAAAYQPARRASPHDAAGSRFALDCGG